MNFTQAKEQAIANSRQSVRSHESNGGRAWFVNGSSIGVVVEKVMTKTTQHVAWMNGSFDVVPDGVFGDELSRAVWFILQAQRHGYKELEAFRIYTLARRWAYDHTPEGWRLHLSNIQTALCERQPDIKHCWQPGGLRQSSQRE